MAGTIIIQTTSSSAEKTRRYHAQSVKLPLICKEIEDAAVQTKPFKFWWKLKPHEIIGLRLWKQMSGKAAPPSKN